MPTPLHLKAPFLPGKFYHMVCKSIDGILLFNDPDDIDVYRERLYHFTQRFMETWSYSLLPNHTHHIIKLHELNIISENFSEEEHPESTIATKAFLADQSNNLLFDRMIERQMNSFLVSYATYHNNKYGRQGGLFQKPFKRIELCDESHLQQAIIYVHANAQRHGLVKDFIHHKHSSYAGILFSDNPHVAGKEVMEFFGGRRQFERLHKDQAAYYYSNNVPSSKLE